MGRVGQRRGTSAALRAIDSKKKRKIPEAMGREETRAVFSRKACPGKQHEAGFGASWKEAKQRAAQSDIFKGCRIVFNGRTGKVSSYYLAKLVREHGGNVASALTATRVTHMVGSNLNGSKADKVLKSCGKVKFVRPEWILQSVKQRKRQPEFEFVVYKNSNATSSLSAAFSRGGNTRTTD
ncbi:hypothetical protein PInf_012580 [Phytophthora infestans]|nr:hypothetical protein PInf_012580 [Phytophthora infestans]